MRDRYGVAMMHAAPDQLIHWPDALIGFGLGLIPALGLWLADRLHDRRIRTTDMQDQWDALCRELEQLIWQSLELHDDDFGHIDSNSAAVRRLVGSHPVDTWRKHLSETEFSLLDDVVSGYGDVEGFGELLEQKLAYAMSNEHVPAEQRQQVAHAVRAAWILGSRWPGEFAGRWAPEILTQAEQVGTNHQFAATAKRFRLALDRFTQSRVDFTNATRTSRSMRYTNDVRKQERKRLRREYRTHPIKTHKRERHNRLVRRSRANTNP
jgi:hypothetical protein